MGEALRSPVAVIGLGNEFRGDDAAGIEVARRVRLSPRAIGVDVMETEPSGLLDSCAGRGGIVIADATRSGAAAGTICRIDASLAPLPGGLRGSSSTHAFGLHEAIELQRVLGGLPRRVIVYGIAGARYDTGRRLSDSVRAKLPELVQMVIDEALALALAMSM